MRFNKILANTFLTISFSILAGEMKISNFSEYTVQLSKGPFAKKINLTSEQKTKSNDWKKIMQKQLVEKVNFAGHYRLYISDHGELPEDCGINGWVCGWVIDKETGRVITELPLFNGNTEYYSTIENNTPSPDPFFTEFYANSNLIWVNGENVPAKKLGIFHLGAINVQIIPMYSMGKYIQLFLGVIAQLLIVSSITRLFVSFNSSLTIILLSGKKCR
ncbi:hypothetical protein ACSMAF_000844 [Cronobacter universalis]